MAIFVDEVRDYGARGDWSHMWTDGSVEDLHAFAASVGLHRDWFQDRKNFPHYDVRPSVRARVLKKGAKFMPLKDWIEREVERRLAERDKRG